MKEGDNVDAAVLVAVELEEGGSTKEVAALDREEGGDGEKGVVVDALLFVIGWGDVFLEGSPKLFKVVLVEDLAGFVVEETRARFLSDAEAKLVFVGDGGLLEELGDLFVGEVLVLLLFSCVFNVL